MKTNMKELIKNVLACATCILSIAVMFGEFIQWLLYV